MRWQNLVLGCGSIVFIIALLPTVFSTRKPPRFTSLLTGVVLLAYGYVDATLGLWYATVTTILLGGLWVFIGTSGESHG